MKMKKNIALAVLTVLILLLLPANIFFAVRSIQITELVKKRLYLPEDVIESVGINPADAIMEEELRMFSPDFAILAPGDPALDGFECLTRKNFCSLALDDGKFLSVSASGNGYDVSWFRQGSGFYFIWNHLTAVDLNGDLLPDYVMDYQKDQTWIIVDGKRREVAEVKAKTATAKDGRVFHWKKNQWQEQGISGQKNGGVSGS